MNKQEAVLQIMEIKAVLTEPLQLKLIEAVKVLADFKMISVDDSMPYDHPNLTMMIGRYWLVPVCIVKYEDGTHGINSMHRDINHLWSWISDNEIQHGKVTHWLSTRILNEPRIMDEYGNGLKFE